MPAVGQRNRAERRMAKFHPKRAEKMRGLAEIMFEALRRKRFEKKDKESGVKLRVKKSFLGLDLRFSSKKPKPWSRERECARWLGQLAMGRIYNYPRGEARV